MTIIPAISLWQPHASLLFVEDPALRKHNETRLGRLPGRCRGVRVAIHATLAIPRRLPAGLPDPHAVAVQAFGWEWRQSLPRGAIIGTLVFTDCVPSEEAEPFSESDRIAGNWGPGRFIWRVAEPALLAEPVPTRGRQGWFKVDVDLAQVGRSPEGQEREDGLGAQHEHAVAAGDAPNLPPETTNDQ
jgi:hypothetical protein